MDRPERQAAGPPEQASALIWTRLERGARGPAAGHSRAELAAAAVALADRSGLAAASVRPVAGELGTGPSSLYRYLGGRTDLLDLMADAVGGEFDLSVPLGGDPVEDLLALAVRARRSACGTPGRRSCRRSRSGWARSGRRTWRTPCGSSPPRGCRVPPGRRWSPSSTRWSRSSPGPSGSRGAAGAERRAAQAAYLGEAAATGAYPHLAAALAEAPGGDPAEAPEALFRRTPRRVLRALLPAGTSD